TWTISWTASWPRWPSRPSRGASRPTGSSTWAATGPSGWTPWWSSWRPLWALSPRSRGCPNRWGRCPAPGLTSPAPGRSWAMRPRSPWRRGRPASPPGWMPSPIPSGRPGRAQAGGGGVPVAEPVTLAVIGAGNRGGDVYAGWCLAHPDQARVVAVADPREARRNLVGDRHQIPPERRFARWEDLLAGPRLADGVIIATPDQMHVEPALRALELGYDILLEKPIAPTRAETLLLSEAAARRGGHITVAHVLRYSPFFSTLKRLVDEGRIGRLMTIDHVENIGYWHFAHSYVRGNWRRADASSPMILAKACHDMDILRWLAGAPCLRVASFGRLSHFRAENRPPGAPDRCTDGCPVEATCP